jgi:TolB-like protein
MQARAEDGDISGALRAYKVLWDLLDEEYGMEPSAKTQQLVAEIKQGSIEPAPAHSPASPPRSPIQDLSSPPETFDAARLAQSRFERPPGLIVPSPSKIALMVNRFEMNGVAPEKAHLVHGFRHHLIASLIRFREWSVVDDVASSSGAKRRAPNAAQYSIGATAYQAGEVANVVMTLRQDETNTFIWSENFELKLENWFEAQQRIIRRTTTSLNVQLSAERLMRLAEEPDVSLAVYDRWLRGQTMLTQFHHADWNRASQIFADVIREAPNFSPGYSSLVAWNNGIHIAQPGTFRDPERARNNVELARKAVQLDALDSRAQLCLGWAYAMAKQYTPAEVHMELARELNENDPWMMISSALFYAFTAKFDQASKLAEQAFERTLSPSLSQWAYLVSIRFLAGDYKSTIEAADRGQDLIRTLRGWKAAALFHLGRHDEARVEADRFLAEIRDFWFGNTLPTDETIVRWFLHLYPISERQHWARLRAGIAGAGLPVSNVEHHGW